MFDFVRLPNPIERLEFDWVRLVFCSVLFDWIGRELLKHEWKSARRKNELETQVASKCFQSFFKFIRNFHKWFFSIHCSKKKEKIMFYLGLAISHLYFLLTALTELEELNVDRTVITDEGCTVLPSKLSFIISERYF